jgi:cell division protein FtsL
MRGVASVLRAAFAVTALVGSLALVTWRQSRAFETGARVDEVRRQISVAEAEQVDLERHIQVLESRTHVVPAARKRLGMHTATTSELVILPGDMKP